MDYKEQKEKYKSALMKWKTDHLLSWFARMPQKPVSKPGQEAIEYANRLALWKRLESLWRTAPKPDRT